MGQRLLRRRRRTGQGPQRRHVLDHDETDRPDTSPEGLAGLKPSFAQIGADAGFDNVALEKYHWLEKINHVHHAGNSSGIVDGAALTLIGTEQVGTGPRPHPARPRSSRPRCRAPTRRSC